MSHSSFYLIIISLEPSIDAVEPLRPRLQRGHLPRQGRLLESNCRQTASPAPALVPRGGAGQSEAEGVRIIRAPSCDVIFMAGIGLSRERIVTERIKYEAY